MSQELERLESNFFIVGMWWRIGYGTLRIVLGLALLKVVGTPFIDLVTKVMNHELMENSNDLLFSFATAFLSHYPFTVTYFVAFYFIFWGIADVVLSYSLIKHKLWAFPLSFQLIGIFIAYELVRFFFTHSLVLLTIIVIDTVILWLIWEEYKKVKLSISIQTVEGAR